MSSKLKAARDEFESRSYYDSDKLLNDEARSALSKVGPEERAQLREKTWENEGLFNKGHKLVKDVFSKDVRDLNERDPRFQRLIKSMGNK